MLNDVVFVYQYTQVTYFNRNCLKMVKFNDKKTATEKNKHVVENWLILVFWGAKWTVFILISLMGTYIHFK